MYCNLGNLLIGVSFFVAVAVIASILSHFALYLQELIKFNVTAKWLQLTLLDPEPDSSHAPASNLGSLCDGQNLHFVSFRACVPIPNQKRFAFDISRLFSCVRADFTSLPPSQQDWRRTPSSLVGCGTRSQSKQPLGCHPHAGEGCK